MYLESMKSYYMSSPRASVLLRCGDGEGGEGGARVTEGCTRLASLVLEVGATAGEAEAEEVGRFWKYCSPGSSSSKPPHGYALTQTKSHAGKGEECFTGDKV